MGHQISGTFAVGDYVISQNGVIWVCITARTQGAWVEIGGGQTPYLPADDGLLAASWDPDGNTSNASPTAGKVYLICIPIRSAFTVTYVVVGLYAAASSSASTGTYAGLYQVNGSSLTLLSGSSDLGSTYTTAVSGVNRALELPLTTPQTLTAGSVVIYAALLFNMTNEPTMIVGSGQRGNFNMGPGQSWPRVCDYSSGGPTALPASGTITSSNIDVVNYSSPVWAGLK